MLLRLIVKSTLHAGAKKPSVGIAKLTDIRTAPAKLFYSAMNSRALSSVVFASFSFRLSAKASSLAIVSLTYDIDLPPSRHVIGVLFQQRVGVSARHFTKANVCIAHDVRDEPDRHHLIYHPLVLVAVFQREAAAGEIVVHIYRDVKNVHRIAYRIRPIRAINC